MNDLHMTTLAGERTAAYRAEADRERLARSVSQVPSRERRAAQRTRRPSLSMIFGRVAIF